MEFPKGKGRASSGQMVCPAKAAREPSGKSTWLPLTACSASSYTNDEGLRSAAWRHSRAYNTECTKATAAIGAHTTAPHCPATGLQPPLTCDLALPLGAEILHPRCQHPNAR